MPRLIVNTYDAGKNLVGSYPISLEGDVSLQDFEDEARRCAEDDGHNGPFTFDVRPEPEIQPPTSWE